MKIPVNAVAQLYWNSPSQAYQIVPQSQLFPSTSNCTSPSSENIVINPQPTAPGNNTITGNQFICDSGTPETIVGSSATGSNVVYLWEFSTSGPTTGFAAAPGTNDIKDYSPGSINQTTWFRRTASNNCNKIISSTVKITVYQPVSLNSITLANGSNSLQAICTNSNPGTISGSTPTGGDGNYAYIWESSTTGPESGFSPATGTNNTANYDPGTLTQTTWFRRTVTSAVCDSPQSNAVEVSVNPVPVLTAISGDTTICLGETTNITGTLTGSAPWTVQGNYERRCFFFVFCFIFSFLRLISYCKHNH